MKTDYTALGREAMERLWASSKQADAVQERLLLDLLHANRHTEYGLKYGFSSINSIKEYQKRAPVSDYSDYGRDIARIIGGEDNILTAEKAVYFCISSGTTGEEKFLPLTETDLRLQKLYAYGAIFGAVREYYRDLDEGEIFGKIFQIGEFAQTAMPDGRINGIRSGCIYQWMNRDGGFDALDYCVPKEVLFPDTLEDLLYVKVRFALAQRDITALHGVFINRMAGVMDYIYENWQLLLKDMEYGTVAPQTGISEKWRVFLTERLPPDPKRAQELRSLPYPSLRDGMIGKIWRKMKYILAIGGEAFPYYTDKMREYAGDIPIHPYAYAASEGIFGIAEKIGVPDRYILFPEAGFFEFLPLSRGGDTGPLCIQELRTGGRYELLFTSHSGLYRYRMNDVIEVVGWYYKAPVVKYCYRKNQVLNIAGEKTNREQLDEAVRHFSRKAKVSVKGYCVREDVSGRLPRYLFYMECAETAETIPAATVPGAAVPSTAVPAATLFGVTVPGAAVPGVTVPSAAVPGERLSGLWAGRAEEILEQCMCEMNYEYKSCAGMNEIAPLRIEFLRPGSFKRYEQKLAAQGKRMGQNKLLHFLDTEEQIRFFAAQRIERNR